MNVLFLSTWFPHPPDNGSKIRVHHLLRALGDRHDVTLLSFAFGTAQSAASEATLPFCDQACAVRRDPFQRGRVVRALTFLSPSPTVGWRLPEMVGLVDATLARSLFDVAIASTGVMVRYLLDHRLPVTKVLEEHNSMSRWARERFEAQRSPLQRARCWVSYQKIRHYEGRVLPRFDLCTMVSEQDKQAALAMLPGYRGPVQVVPNGVDCARNQSGLVPIQPDTLVYNGALTYSANYDAMRHFLSRVYPSIRAQMPEISMTITGATTDVALERLELDESVHLTGYLDDVRPVVGGSAVCVVPIREGGGTRLKILEAMALGTPVVATSKGAEGLDVTHGHDVLIADEPDDFAAQVLRLLRDQGLRRRLAKNARRLVEERYDWVQIGERFVDLVEQAVREHGARGAEG